MPSLPVLLGRRARGLALAGAVLAWGAASPVASAAAKGHDFGCDVTPTLSQAFAPFGDMNEYAPVTNGGLENGSTGWKITKGASIVDDNEPWDVSGPGTHALDLPSGTSAITPPICITPAYPFFRLFAEDVNANDAKLRVEVLFDGGTGRVGATAPVAYTATGGGWQPTPPFPIGIWTDTTSTAQVPVAFRFTPIGASAHFRIDDVYVDPWSRH